ATKGRIKQSIAHWCFEDYWSVEKTCQIAKELGCKSVELVKPKDWPMLKEYGLVCALHGSHWFDNGMNNPEFHEMCIGKMRKSIDECAEAGFPNVITLARCANPLMNVPRPAFPTLSPSPAKPVVSAPRTAS
ncbi:MAG: hypothetical protein ACYS8I_15075, partial [Planctomycetota bacterium]